VERMTGYLINARKRPLTKSHDTKFSYDFRFYFTCAKIIKAHEKAVNGNDFVDAAANDMSMHEIMVDPLLADQSDMMNINDQSIVNENEAHVTENDKPVKMLSGRLLSASSNSNRFKQLAERLASKSPRKNKIVTARRGT
jgi:CBS-domain-containing membrane protein